MKKALPYLAWAAIIIGAVLFFEFKLGTLNKSYWIERKAYDEAVKAADAQRAADLAVIDSQKKVIADQDATLAAIRAAAGQPTPDELAKDRQIADLEGQIAAFKAQGDLRAALSAAEAGLRAWADKFTLAERRHADAFAALDRAWQAKFDAQVVISNTWEDAYNREHGLRLTCDALRLKAEKPRGVLNIFGLKVNAWDILIPAVAFGAGVAVGK